MKFITIPGYAETKNRLTSAVRLNRFGHAVTFLGETGGGQMALALATVQYMLCADRSENDSCGECPSCKKISRFIHPDVHFYFPTATSTDVPKQALSSKYMETWRSFLSENAFFTLSEWLEAMGAAKKEALIPADESLQIMRDLSLKSYESPYRYALIWLPEKMNLSAANKLLKIIEEPPNNVFFMLISENVEAILPTILSRTQIVRAGKTDDASLLNWLQNQKLGAGSDLQKAVLQADGNPYLAFKAATETLVDPQLTEDFMNWARLCYEAYKKMPELIDWSDDMAAKRRDEQKSFLIYGLHFFREALMKNSGGEDYMQSDGGEKAHILKFAPFVNEANRIDLIDTFDQACYHLERYANVKILFTDVSLRFARLINAKNVHL